MFTVHINSRSNHEKTAKTTNFCFSRCEREAKGRDTPGQQSKLITISRKRLLWLTNVTSFRVCTIPPFSGTYARAISLSGWSDKQTNFSVPPSGREQTLAFNFYDAPSLTVDHPPKKRQLYSPPEKPLRYKCDKKKVRPSPLSNFQLEVHPWLSQLRIWHYQKCMKQGHGSDRIKWARFHRRPTDKVSHLTTRGKVFADDVQGRRGG